MFNKLKEKTKILIISSASVLLAVGLILLVCWLIPRIKIDAPEGFAVNQVKADAKEFVCVSPEGIRFRVKIIDNKPKQQLDFWAQALKNKLDQSGYTFLHEEPFLAGKNSGIYCEWGAPLGNSDYVYMTAIVISGNHMAVCESAGERGLMEGYRNVFLESLKTIAYD
jgi:hypothetical protein